MRMAGQLWWSRWRRICDLFRETQSEMVDDMPITLVERLKAEGLL